MSYHTEWSRAISWVIVPFSPSPLPGALAAWELSGDVHPPPLGTHPGHQPSPSPFMALQSDFVMSPGWVPCQAAAHRLHLVGAQVLGILGQSGGCGAREGGQCSRALWKPSWSWISLSCCSVGVFIVLNAITILYEHCSPFLVILGAVVPFQWGLMLFPYEHTEQDFPSCYEHCSPLNPSISAVKCGSLAAPVPPDEAVKHGELKADTSWAFHCRQMFGAKPIPSDFLKAKRAQIIQFGVQCAVTKLPMQFST